MLDAQALGDEPESALRRAGLALYRLAWSAMFLAAIIMPVLAAAQLARIAGPAPGSRATPALPFRVEAWLLYTLNLLPALFLTAAAVLLFWRRGRERVAMILSFSFLSSAASMPFVEPWLARGPFEGLRVLVELSAPLTGLLGMMLFPDGRFVPRWVAVPALLLLPWTIARFFHAFALPLDAALNDLFGLIVIVSVVIRYRRLAAGSVQQQQIRWAVFGMAIGLVLNNFAMFLFARMSTPIDDATRSWMLIAARALLMGFYVFMSGGLLISLLRYRLYDADAVISRSAAFAATTLLLAAVFAGTAEGAKWTIEHGLGQQAGLFPAAIAAALATLLVTPAHDHLRNWASERFQKALNHMRREVPLAVSDRRETASMDELLADLLARLTAGTRTVRAAVLLGLDPVAARGTGLDAVTRWLETHRPDDAARHLDCRRDDPVFPLRIPLRDDSEDRSPIGWLLLGPRPDGSFYGRDEREALAEIADPVARAVRIVQLREMREADRQALDARQERRLAALERRLARLMEAGRPAKVRG